MPEQDVISTGQQPMAALLPLMGQEYKLFGVNLDIMKQQPTPGALH